MESEPRFSGGSQSRPKRSFWALSRNKQLILGLLASTIGCSAPEAQAPETPTPVASSSPEPTPTPPDGIAPVNRLDLTQELHVFLQLRVLSQEVIRCRNKLEILQKESELEGGKFNQGLASDIRVQDITLHVIVYKTLKNILSCHPYSWARLCRSVFKISREETVPEVSTTKDLQKLGKLSQPEELSQLKELQKVLYGEIIDRLACLVAWQDTDLQKMQGFLQENLAPDVRQQVENKRQAIAKERQRLIDLLQKGGLFPKHPTPAPGMAKQLLERFDRTREEKGGLPKGNAVRPKSLHFGPLDAPAPAREAEEGAPVHAPEPRQEAPQPKKKVRFQRPRAS